MGTNQPESREKHRQSLLSLIYRILFLNRRVNSNSRRVYTLSGVGKKGVRGFLFVVDVCCFALVVNYFRCQKEGKRKKGKEK